MHQKFEPGQKVVRVGNTHAGCKKGEVYTVVSCVPSAIWEGTYQLTLVQLAGHFEANKFKAVDEVALAPVAAKKITELNKREEPPANPVQKFMDLHNNNPDACVQYRAGPQGVWITPKKTTKAVDWSPKYEYRATKILKRDLVMYQDKSPILFIPEVHGYPNAKKVDIWVDFFTNEVVDVRMANV